MNYEIVELKTFSGNAAKVYSILPEGEPATLFEQFVVEHKQTFPVEIKEIAARLRVIGHTTGAREIFFKNEGNRDFVNRYGNCICALYDDEAKNLRLYCIRFSNVAIILGGGGHKPKTVIKWQDNEKLAEEVERIKSYAIEIFEQLKSGELKWSKDGTSLEGNLKKHEDE
ncbi:MAG: hypothetical protein C0424_06005 [Sphingobacteriaceae bacterium]|nr:hypothetical protein [Sphingobacteriaceae bacterium]